MSKVNGHDVSVQEANDSDSSGVNSNIENKVKVAFAGLDNRLYFALKSNTKLRRVAEIFAENAKIPLDSIKLVLDGREIPIDATPQSCGMVDSDVVDVSQRTDGGFSNDGFFFALENLEVFSFSACFPDTRVT